MSGDALRPRVSVIGDRIHVFVGSAHQALPLDAAVSLNEQLAAAIDQLEAQEADKA